MTDVITQEFTQDHHRCDRLLAEAESALSGRDWQAGSAPALDALILAMEQHFVLEEQVLFPELAAVFRVAANPIGVMLDEHAQMRALFADLREALERQDRDACLGGLETLNFLVRQHNYKEEEILYPMADGALRGRAEGIVAQLPTG